MRMKKTKQTCILTTLNYVLMYNSQVQNFWAIHIQVFPHTIPSEGCNHISVHVATSKGREWWHLPCRRHWCWPWCRSPWTCKNKVNLYYLIHCMLRQATFTCVLSYLHDRTSHSIEVVVVLLTISSSLHRSVYVTSSCRLRYYIGTCLMQFQSLIDNLQDAQPVSNEHGTAAIVGVQLEDNDDDWCGWRHDSTLHLQRVRLVSWSSQSLTTILYLWFVCLRNKCQYRWSGWCSLNCFTVIRMWLHWQESHGWYYRNASSK